MNARRLLAALACALPAVLHAGCTADSPPAGATKPHAGESGSPWFDGPYEDALAEARATQKLVFIDFWTSWCPPCKKLEKETFPHPDVRAELSKLVALSIDAESPTGAPVATKHRVGAYPTLLVLRADGTEVGRHAGFLPPAQFVEKIASFRARAGS